jgi:ribosome-binding protein aMBF1 (putative translation factor)
MGRFETGRQDVNETAVIQACAQCGEPIAPPRKLYCSDRCANLAYLARVAEAASANNVNDPAANNVNSCRHCREPITRPATRRPRLYCSDSCRVMATRARAAERSEKAAEWIPWPGDKTSRAAMQRRHLISEYAARGLSSGQISERIGISAQTIRRIAREMGTEIPADSILRNTHHLDSSRIVAKTASALEGLAIGVGLVSLDDLDPAQMKDWADSLTASIRELDRFIKTMKENAQ